MNERFEALADAHALGEPLDAAALAELAAYDDDEIATERDVYVQLSAMGAPTAEDHAVDFARAQQTLAAFEQRRAGARRRPWRIALLAGGLAAAAAVLLVVALPEPQLAAPGGSGVVLSSGTLLSDQAQLASGEALPKDRWVVAKDRACVEAADATTCIGPEARVRARGTGVELDDGEAEFQGEGELWTRYGRLHTADAVFTVQLTSDRMLVTVTAGRVTLVDADGREVEWTAGDTETITSTAHADAEVDEDEIVVIDEDDGAAVEDDEGDRDTDAGRRPSTPPPSAGELLSLARSQVAEGKETKAVATYARLQRLYPRSAEARIAHVSLGQLQLRRGAAKAALKAFDHYLDGGGPLAEEAYWGKIRALHQLHRASERDATIAKLRSKYPASVYLSRASALAGDDAAEPR